MYFPYTLCSVPTISPGAEQWRRNDSSQSQIQTDRQEMIKKRNRKL
jgi:hypothetical protein